VPLYLTEDDVTRLLTMEACIEAVEEAFRQLDAGQASNRPRSRAHVRGGTLHVLPAASEVWSRMAVKTYASTRGGTRFVILLFDLRSSDLLAVIEADRLGQIRTGAASAVATRHLARADAARLAVIGTGWQARGQVGALAAVRQLLEIRAYGRDRKRLVAFCTEIESGCGVRTVPATSAEEAVRGADIVTTATSSATPVMHGAWLARGMHINAVGSNRTDRRELDEDAVRRADRIIVDSLEQAALEAGDLMVAAEERDTPMARAIELGALVSGRQAGRMSEKEITLFESLGVGLEDLAAATTLYDLARARGAGRPLPNGG
jgi:ornithine cyclodeaminase/alanine dehydrogenase-like protein (mu-crystallin family)